MLSKMIYSLCVLAIFTTHATTMDEKKAEIERAVPSSQCTLLDENMQINKGIVQAVRDWYVGENPKREHSLISVDANTVIRDFYKFLIEAQDLSQNQTPTRRPHWHVEN